MVQTKTVNVRAKIARTGIGFLSSILTERLFATMISKQTQNTEHRQKRSPGFRNGRVFRGCRSLTEVARQHQEVCERHATVAIKVTRRPTT